MIEGSPYMFCFQNENYAFWNDYGAQGVGLSTNPYFLKFSPAGWNDIGIKNVVNSFYKGIDRSVTIPLKYIVDGSNILKSIAYSKGFEEKVYFTIVKQELRYKKVSGSITGGPNISSGTNTGTITIPAGETVYVTITLTPGNSSDMIQGNIGASTLVNIGNGHPNSFTFPITGTGTINWNLFLINNSGTATATIELTNASGSAVDTFLWYYRKLIRAEVDWNTFNHNNAIVTVTMLEDGLPKYLKAGDRTIHEIPLDTEDSIYFKADGIRLHQKANFFVGNGSLENNNGNHLVDLNLVTQEGLEANIKGVERLSLGNPDDTSLPAQRSAWFFYSSNGENVQAEWDFTCNVELASGVSANPAIQLSFICNNYSNSGTLIQGTVLNQHNGEFNVYRTIRFQGSASIPVQADSGLYLIMRVNVVGSSGDEATIWTYDTNNPGFFNISATYRKAPTYVRARKPFYIFDELLNRITAGKYRANPNSTFLTVDHWDKVFTSGNAFRLLNKPTIKISLQDFFSFLDVNFDVGMILQNDKVDIVYENSLTDENDVTDLGIPDYGTLSINVDGESRINEIQAGYPEIRNEVGVLNALDEFNQKMIFSRDATNGTGVLNMVSPTVRTSCYDTEGIRIFTDGKTSTDYKNDNEPYCIHIERTLRPAKDDVPAHYRIDRSLNALVTDGLTEPESVFNLFFRPALMIKRKGSSIRGRFYGGDGVKFKFRSADKNSRVICDGVVDQADFYIGDLAAAKFIPWNATFDAVPPLTLLDLLDQNPLRCFSFEAGGTKFKGKPLAISLVPNKNNSQNIELRLLASNNLQKLISYDGQ